MCRVFRNGGFKFESHDGVERCGEMQRRRLGGRGLF